MKLMGEGNRNEREREGGKIEKRWRGKIEIRRRKNKN